MESTQQHAAPPGAQFEEVLQFWFPSKPVDGEQFRWWFGGGARAEVLARFALLLKRAQRGELEDWSRAPRSRLALIIVLDQFSRTVYQGTAEAFAQDPQALSLALEGMRIGHYAALATPWEKTFFLLPLGHSEELAYLQMALDLAEALVQEATPETREILAFSAAQACANRDVLARFGRQPHRNAILGRPSTPAEMEYLAEGQFVHKRSFEEWKKTSR